MNNKTFGSISSDNNVFDLGHIFRRTMKDMEFTQDMFVLKVREYFKAKMSYLNELEMANIVTSFLTAEMTFERFQQSMDILGCGIDITIKMPVKKLSERAAETGQRPPQYLFWDKSIDELMLTVRASNVLKANNVEYFGQLVALPENEVRRFVNMGPVTFKHLKSAMREHGLDFGTDVKGWEPVDPKEVLQNMMLLKKGVEFLQLPREINNVFEHHAIHTLEMLCSLNEEYLATLDLTPRDTTLIILALREKGLKLAAGTTGKPADVFDREFDQVLDLDVSTINALHTFGFSSLGSVVKTDADTMRKLPNVGQVRFDRLVKELKFMRLSLGMDIDWKPASGTTV